MVELFSLIKNLHPEEALEIKRALKEKGNDSLLRKLFAFISASRKEKVADRELCMALYGRYKKSAMGPLKSRLFHFVLEVMVSNKLISKNELYDANDKRMLKLRKKMLQFRALYRKKNKPDVLVLFHLLNEIISDAKETEQYDVLVDALSFKKIILKVRRGFAEVKSIEQELDKYQYAYQALLKANDHYIDLITNQDQVKEKGLQSIITNLRVAIREIKQSLVITRSPTIQYYYHLLQLELLIKTKKFNTALLRCMQIKRLLEKHPVLFRSERMGFVFDNISHIQVYKLSFAEAVKGAREAQKFYSPNSISYLLSKQQEFFSAFYGSNYGPASALIEEMLVFPLLNKGEFRHDKYLFFKACVLFKKGKYKEAFVICNLALKLNKDKGRWDLGIRYLRLMCQVELRDDKAYDSIEALRKTVERLGAQKLLTSRDELIYKLFNEYAAKAFSAKANPKLVRTLQQINAPENAWSFYSHEPIPINAWIRDKTASR